MKESKRQMRKYPVKRLKINDKNQRKSIMNFQHLPNEIYQEIFDYLRPINIMQTFYGLDYRLDQLIENIPMKLNFQNSNKKEYRHVLKQFVPKIIKQIVMIDLGRSSSLSFHSEILIDLFNQSFQWNQFPNLQHLSLTSPNLEQLESLLSVLPNLCSLRSFRLLEQDRYDSQNETICKLVLANHNYQLNQNIRLSIDTSPPFRYLKLLQKCLINKISLDYLQINFRCSLFFYPDSLTHLDYDGLTQMISNMNFLKIDVMCGIITPIFALIRRFSRIQYLSIQTVIQAYANGYQWADILSQLPNLIKIDMKINLDSSKSHEEFETFQTKFWSERQWFFYCQKNSFQCQFKTRNINV